MVRAHDEDAQFHLIVFLLILIASWLLGLLIECLLGIFIEWLQMLCRDFQEWLAGFWQDLIRPLQQLARDENLQATFILLLIGLFIRCLRHPMQLLGEGDEYLGWSRSFIFAVTVSAWVVHAHHRVDSALPPGIQGVCESLVVM